PPPGGQPGGAAPPAGDQPGTTDPPSSDRPSRPDPAGGRPARPKLQPLPGFRLDTPQSTSAFLPLLHQVERGRAPPAPELTEEEYREILAQAVEEFGEGRAGAGGISLHTSAQPLAPLDLSRVRRASVEQGRLVLHLPDGPVTGPPVDEEYLALALRDICAGAGKVAGTLLANDPLAVVVKTGRDRFGDVAWKKEFLAGGWRSVARGERVALALGPAIGLLSEPAPSTNRVTYYGSIRHTRMGQVLVEADSLLVTMLYGIDWRTGRPVAPPDLDGFMTFLERSIRRVHEEQAPRPAAEAPPPAQWWNAATWLVWVPERFTLKLSDDRQTLRFVDTRMKLVAWSGGPEGPAPDFVALAHHVTEHYDQLARTHPVLGQLIEVAKATTLARLLKAHDVAVDPQWARTRSIQRVETPATLRDYRVIPLPDAQGRPLIEPAEER
ncbi:MAG: hypothetical protein ACYTEZ_07700, partial [Planctomycetota bacterium]